MRHAFLCILYPVKTSKKKRDKRKFEKKNMKFHSMWQSNSDLENFYLIWTSKLKWQFMKSIAVFVINRKWYNICNYKQFSRFYLFNGIVNVILDGNRILLNERYIYNTHTNFQDQPETIDFAYFSWCIATLTNLLFQDNALLIPTETNQSKIVCGQLLDKSQKLQLWDISCQLFCLYVWLVQFICFSLCYVSFSDVPDVQT